MKNNIKLQGVCYKVALFSPKMDAERQERSLNTGSMCPTTGILSLI